VNAMTEPDPAGFFPAGRDRGVTVAVEGFFAFAWFGWGQGCASSPSAWPP
jgi:hypothetical protein